MKRRYVQDPNPPHDLIEVGDDYIGDPRVKGDTVLWNDRSYQDAGDSRFHSRTEHREYMRQNGLTTMDDFTHQWARQAEQRREFLEGRRSDPRQKEVIARAIQQHSRGSR